MAAGFGRHGMPPPAPNPDHLTLKLVCELHLRWDTAVPAEGNGDLQTLILCPCGETQTMSHIVESCPLTKLNGSLSRLHSADEDAVSWLTSYDSWHAYEKKKI